MGEGANEKRRTGVGEDGLYLVRRRFLSNECAQRELYVTAASKDISRLYSWALTSDGQHSARRGPQPDMKFTWPVCASQADPSSPSAATMISTLLTELLRIRMCVFAFLTYTRCLSSSVFLDRSSRVECNGTSITRLHVSIDTLLYRVGTPPLVSAISNAGGLGEWVQLVCTPLQTLTPLQES